MAAVEHDGLFHLCAATPGDSPRPRFYTPGTEVRLDPDLQSKLSRIAAARGSDAEMLAREAIKRFVDDDEWFIREVEKGLASADRGALLTHEQVGARIERRLANKHRVLYGTSLDGRSRYRP